MMRRFAILVAVLGILALPISAQAQTHHRRVHRHAKHHHHRARKADTEGYNATAEEEAEPLPPLEIVVVCEDVNSNCPQGADF